MADKPVTHVTPRGVFRYPRLNVADTKFKEGGEYSVQLVLAQEAAEGLMQLVTEAHDDWYKRYAAEKKKAKAAPRKKADYPYIVEIDPETEQETGNVIFKFKMTASGISKKTGRPWSRRPAVFDAKGKPVDLDAVSIWGGSEGKVAFSMFEYESTPQQGAGISLKIEAVQLLKLVEGSTEREANDFGFEEEEGYSEEETTEETTGDADAETGEDTGDF